MKKVAIAQLFLLILFIPSGLWGQKDYPVQLVTTRSDSDLKDTILLEYQDWPVLLHKIITKVDGNEDFKGAETIFTYNDDGYLERIVDKAHGMDLSVQEFYFEYNNRFLQKITRRENGKEDSVDIFYNSPTTTYSFADPNGQMWNYIYKKGDLVAVRNCGREVSTYYYENDGQMDQDLNQKSLNGPYKNLNQWPLAGYHMVSSLLRSSRMAHMVLRRQLLHSISYDHTFIYTINKLDEFSNVAQIDFRHAEDDTPFQTTYITYKTIRP